jgi:hypothetical protein
MKIKGEYKDILVKNDRIIEERGWKSNTIAEDYGRFLAALMKKEDTIAGTGIEYIAVGGGNASIDEFTNNVKTFFKTNTLTEPPWAWTKQIQTGDIIYLDKDGNPAKAKTITNRLQIDVTIKEEEPTEKTFVFEQFALLGINAAKDNMFLINYVDHGPITKDSSMKLERTIRLTFPAGGE